MSHVLVIGDVVDDIVVRPLDGVTPASDTTATIRTFAGGSAANTAAWLGWLGSRVTFVGRAGLGGGERHTSALAQHRVDARVSEEPSLPTATIVLMVDRGGERTMFVDRGANATLTPAHVPAEVWDDAGWVHLTGYSFFCDNVRPLALAVLDEARRRGIGVSLDPSSVAFLRTTGLTSFLTWTEGVDVIFPNYDEGRELTGLQQPREIVEALGRRYGTVALTLGGHGSLVRTAAGEIIASPAAPANLDDLTGAGDAYCAGFLAAWQAEMPWRECVRVATETSAMAVSRVGGRP
ncbi:MAG: sugar kinase [Nocardioidaceae bacterium]|nr:sugar kinase [Nocardioidaceae bacterium]